VKKTPSQPAPNKNSIAAALFDFHSTPHPKASLVSTNYRSAALGLQQFPIFETSKLSARLGSLHQQIATREPLFTARYSANRGPVGR
jgi:hypothetical protein